MFFLRFLVKKAAPFWGGFASHCFTAFSMALAVRHVGVNAAPWPMNPISNKGNKFGPTIYNWHPRILRPSYGPGQGCIKDFN